jgi:hypothetical protein
LPAPLDAGKGGVFFQAELPQLLEYAGSLPLLKPAVGRTLLTEAGVVQRLPLTTGAQHEENGVHGGSVGHARIVTTQRVGLGRGQQRFDPLPQCIGNPPAIIIGHGHGHLGLSFRDTF